MVPIKSLTFYLNPRIPFNFMSNALSTITTLVLVGTAGEPIINPSTPEFPALLHLSLINTVPDYIPPFISRHSQQLISLHLSFPTTVSSHALMGGYIFTNLPSLQSLTLNSWSLIMRFPRTIGSIPKLSHIGIYEGQTGKSPSLFELTYALEDLVPDSPSLKFIRVMKGVSSRELINGLAAFLKEHRAGFRIEEV